jgi:hypothetical protein
MAVDYQPYVLAEFYCQNAFLVLISAISRVNPWPIVWLEVFGILKKCNDLIVTRTRALPACSIASKKSTLSRARCVHNRLGLERPKYNKIFIQYFKITQYYIVFRHIIDSISCIVYGVS